SVRRAMEIRMKRGELLAASIRGAGRIEHWCRPDTLDRTLDAAAGVHILSPFDPLVIQRKRLKLFFGYEHVFEAYIPREKRVYGYFGLPVLLDGDIVAVLDLKADRARGELLLQKWSWVGRGGSPARKRAIEEKLHVFEQFQFAS